MISNRILKIRIAVLSILAVLVFLFVGCASIIGLGVGLVVDNDKRGNSPNISMASFKGFEPGTTIIIREKDSTEFKCQYLGFARRVDSDSVLTQPQTLSDSVGALMPYFGETITVIDTSGATATYRFLSFHYHFVDNEWVPRMAVGSNADSATDNISIYSINEIQIGDSHSISKAQIMEYVGGAGFPQNCEIFVKDSSGVKGIPINSIENIKMPRPPRSKSHWMTGLIVGFCIDAVIFTAFLYGLHESLKHWE